MSNSRLLSTSTRSPPSAVFLNAGRLDYDGALDFGRLSSITSLTLHRVDGLNYANDPEEIVRRVKECDAEIIITKEMELPASAVRAFGPSVRLICEAGTGYNNIPVREAHDRDVDVCNVPEYSTDAVAHMAVTYLMNFSSSMFQQQAMLLRGDRSNFTDRMTVPLSELGGKTLGLVGGAGRIGSRVADVALALGMDVIVSSRAGRLPEGHRLAGHARVRTVADVDGLLLPVADYVSIHCPLNDETRGSFGRKQIERMKPSAFLINTARGAILDEAELIECMREGLIAGAGLDTQSSEPPPQDSGLWTLPNVWMTPHAGWRRLETRQRLIDQIADNIEAYISAGKATNIVN
eukprot:CAMPEP_0194293254 /NCGR_PEP_ID=MMETSP0169-20130528/47521_1 /TAXON_ID=218684 /ORGANISM="Corethron pennatum, Strain L29A3" /LENGTH=349 /DNA_ID=CAMNT_0039041701 /DNA_START=55 /DNA_END=1104 /DNA_ORIENTATION=-